MTINLQGRETEAKFLYADSLEKALAICQMESYQALFMPQIAEARANAPANSDMWAYWISTPSIRATGRTKSGTPVVVYAHRDNHFSNPGNILQAKEKGLINYAGIIPWRDFQDLVDSDGQTDGKGNRLVWIIDYNKLKSSPRGVVSVDKALEHPQTIPFLGGEQISQQYLKRHAEVLGKHRIGVWHTDDLHDEPLGRLLVLGDNFTVNSGLSAFNILINDGRFVAVRGAECVQTNKVFTPPPIEDILESTTLSGIEEVLPNNPKTVLGHDNIITEMLNYGRCVGIIAGEKLIVKPHTYSDGKKHYTNSDGLCPDCLKISEAVRFQRKISKLEETLNRDKSCQTRSYLEK